MQRIKFPDDWVVRIDSVPALAKRLKISEAYLQRLRKEIPLHYRYKKLEKRILRIPSTRLKAVQRMILKELLAKDLPYYVHGGITRRSIRTNAATHVHGKWVMKLDIKRFFPSVNYKRIENIFLSLGCSKEVAEVLTQFTTLDKELPQGTPTSPMLANLVLYNIDRRIDGLCQSMRFVYSRYFDDITISGSENPDKILLRCKEFVQQENFVLNKEKEGITRSQNGCVITGILVKQGTLSMPPELREKFFANLMKAIEGEFEEDPIKTEDKLRGQLAFLKSIDVEEWKRARVLFKKISFS